MEKKKEEEEELLRFNIISPFKVNQIYSPYNLDINLDIFVAFNGTFLFLSFLFFFFITS